MAQKPAADVRIDGTLVSTLLLAQARHVPGIDVEGPVKLAEGWDCESWTCGPGLAVRLPRRRPAAALVRHEQRHLPAVAERLAGVVAVPAPVFAGSRDAGFPWPWSVVPWFEGEPGIRLPRPERSAWVETLAAALMRLHTPAHDPPPNPVRGVPLVRRDAAVRRYLGELPSDLPPRHAAAAHEAWQQALSAPAWAGPPLWIHGDLHPANVVHRGGRLTALIDFGDITAGDPAYDLGIAWLAFDGEARERMRSLTSGVYDDDTWVRARGWAAAVAALLLGRSDDDVDYRTMARATLEEIAAD